MVSYIIKHRGRTIFLITFIITSTLGLINLSINKTNLVLTIGNSSGRLIGAIISTFVVAMFVEVVYCIFTSVLIYFYMAAVGDTKKLKDIYGISARILIGLPIITVVDMIGFLTINNRFSYFGALGLIAYSPFYLVSFFVTYSIAKELLNLTSKSSLILAVLVTALVGVLSIPA